MIIDAALVTIGIVLALTAVCAALVLTAAIAVAIGRTRPAWRIRAWRSVRRARPTSGGR